MSTSPSWWTSTSNHLSQSQKVPAAYAAGTFSQAASSGPHGTWGGAARRPSVLGPRPKTLMPAEFISAEQIRSRGPRQGISLTGHAAKERYEHLTKLVDLYK